MDNDSMKPQTMITAGIFAFGLLLVFFSPSVAIASAIGLTLAIVAQMPWMRGTQLDDRKATKTVFLTLGTTGLCLMATSILWFLDVIHQDEHPTGNPITWVLWAYTGHPVAAYVVTALMTTRALVFVRASAMLAVGTGNNPQRS